MNLLNLPPLVSPGALYEVLSHEVPGNESLLLVCTGSREQYLAAHIPGAIHLDPGTLNTGSPPTTGLLPEVADLERVFSQLGLTAGTHVVCYDDAATTSAARLFWVLESLGHNRVSYLNGGLAGWQAAGLPVKTGDESATPGDWTATPDDSVVTDRNRILNLLNNGDVSEGRVRILDSRSPEEYAGIKSASERKGRIPGAINFNWLDTIGDDRMLKPAGELLQRLNELGISADDEVIVHCQTHQRSSHSFMMLRSLGFTRVRGYPGSWSDWSQHPESPVFNATDAE